MQSFQYKDFGVDIDSGNEFVNRLKPLVKETFSPLVLGGLGGFSGAFTLPSDVKEPVICVSSDGVGSKLSLAIAHNRLEDIGIDLVAMCVNDLICDFAVPLVFLDYYAVNSLDIEKSLVVLKGVIKGCKIAGCSLIGGESAEMPSIYRAGEFDLAGFGLGVAERADMDRRQSISDGDVVLGLPSSGFHSNGYSLIRGIIESKKLSLDSMLSSLLKPTRIYVDIFKRFRADIKALAHITGGGIAENLVRVLPKNVSAIIDSKAIKTPQIIESFLPFVDRQEAFRVFNMGIGMAIVASKNKADSIMQNSDAYIIGHIESTQGKSEVKVKYD